MLLIPIIITIVIVSVYRVLSILFRSFPAGELRLSEIRRPAQATRLARVGAACEPRPSASVATLCRWLLALGFLAVWAPLSTSAHCAQVPFLETLRSPWGCLWRTVLWSDPFAVLDKRSRHLGADGVYLDDLTDMDPEVAALYFPKK